jgi:hypothetical protein
MQCKYKQTVNKNRLKLALNYKLEAYKYVLVHLEMRS